MGSVMIQASANDGLLGFLYALSWYLAILGIALMVAISREKSALAKANKTGKRRVKRPLWEEREQARRDEAKVESDRRRKARDEKHRSEQDRIVESNRMFEQITVGRVGKKALREIIESCRPGEKPEFIIGAGAAGALAAFGDRCVIVKKGGMTSFMAGATGGGRMTTFHYVDVMAIEYNSGWVTGTLEILTPSHDAGRASDTWKMSGTSGSGSSSWELPNVLPLSKMEYGAARVQINRMQELIAASKRPQVADQAPPHSDFDIASQLARLSELHGQGALDDEEFRRAKIRILGDLDPGQLPESAEPRQADVLIEKEAAVEKRQSASEPKLVNVHLLDPGEKKVPVIKSMRRLFGGLGIREAKQIVDRSPTVIAEAVDLTRANGIVSALTDAGAHAEIRNE